MIMDNVKGTWIDALTIIMPIWFGAYWVWQLILSNATTLDLLPELEVKRPEYGSVYSPQLWTGAILTLYFARICRIFLSYFVFHKLERLFRWNCASPCCLPHHAKHCNPPQEKVRDADKILNLSYCQMQFWRIWRTLDNSRSLESFV